MKRFIFLTVLSLVFAGLGFAQSKTFADKNAEYTFELPESIWKELPPSTSSTSVEFVYGDRMDGHLKIRKTAIKEEEIISDLVHRDHEQELQFLPGYVQGKEEQFAGVYRGRVFNYEFVKSGKLMSGRFYYLKVDDNTVYVLRFTGLKNKLILIRNETDSIARTFKLKANN